MKAILINLGIIALIGAMYYFKIWQLLSSQYASAAAVGLVVVMLLIGIKVLGNPFGKRK